MTSQNVDNTWSYKQIVVAIDDSLLSKKAFRQALAIAKAFKANLNLIHILLPIEEEFEDLSPINLSNVYSPVTIDESLPQRWQAKEERGLELLRSLREIAKANGVHAISSQLVGQPEQKICEFAQELNADLIVIGSHGRTGLSELFLGSVSNYVSHHVPCAVLLVHQSETEA